MILKNSIENNNKLAIRYGLMSYTYADIKNQIVSRASVIQNTCKGVLLSSTNELENLFNLLAYNYLGIKCVFAGKNANAFQLEMLAKYLELEIVTDLKFELKDNLNYCEPKINLNQVFLGVLSSGSTGVEKVIWKDYQSWVSAFTHQADIFGIDESDHVFVLDALAYSANLNTALHTLWLGGTLILGKLKEAKNWAEQFKQELVSSVFMVPSHYRLLVANNVELNHVRSLVSAGEKLDINTAQNLISLCPTALLTEFYGAAELGHISYHQGAEILNQPLALGTAFPEVNITIKEGEIWVQSPYVSPDYRDKPTVLDLGYMHNDLLYVLGRSGRMFNRRGLNIYAEEIENSALLHPFVWEAVAFQSETNNKANITLVYVAHKSEKLHYKELNKHLQNVLPKAKLPNLTINVSQIPRLENGKINFKALSKMPEEAELN